MLLTHGDIASDDELDEPDELELEEPDDEHDDMLEMERGESVLR